MSIIENFIKGAVKDVPNFPIPGHNYKDISPLLQEPQLCRAAAEAFINHAKRLRLDVVVAIEGQGFIFGALVAQRLDLPFVMVRRQGQLPGETLAISFKSGFQNKTLELQTGCLAVGQRVLMHDDTLATGNTMKAASDLITRAGGKIAGYSFILQRKAMGGRKLIRKYSSDIFSLVTYD